MTAKSTAAKKTTAPAGKNLIRAIKGTAKKNCKASTGKKKPVQDPKERPASLSYKNCFMKPERMVPIRKELLYGIAPKPEAWFVAFKDQLVYAFSETGFNGVVEVIDEKHAAQLYAAQEKYGYHFAGLIAGAKRLVPEPPTHKAMFPEVPGEYIGEVRPNSAAPYIYPPIVVPDPLQYLKDLKAQATGQAQQAPDKQEPKKKRDLWSWEKKWLIELQEEEMKKPEEKRMSIAEMQTKVVDYHKKVKSFIKDYIDEDHPDLFNDMQDYIYYFLKDNSGKYSGTDFSLLQKVPIDILKTFSDEEVSKRYLGDKKDLLSFLDKVMKLVDDLSTTNGIEAWFDYTEVYFYGYDKSFSSLAFNERHYRRKIKEAKAINDIYAAEDE